MSRCFYHISNFPISLSPFIFCGIKLMPWLPLIWSQILQMRARLSGGHFRMLNEKLYTCRFHSLLPIHLLNHNRKWEDVQFAIYLFSKKFMISFMKMREVPIYFNYNREGKEMWGRWVYGPLTLSYIAITLCSND